MPLFKINEQQILLSDFSTSECSIYEPLQAISIVNIFLKKSN
jgi:hypothetical protein